MFVNPGTPENPMRHRRALTKGQQVAISGLGGFFDDVVSAVSAPIKQAVNVVSNVVTAPAQSVSNLFQTAKGVALAPIMIGVGTIVGASGGKGIAGAIQGGAGGLRYSTGIDVMPRTRVDAKIVPEPVFYPVTGNIGNFNISPPRPDLLAPTANATIGYLSAINQPQPVPQASYGQLPYAPTAAPGYDGNGDPLPPPKKEIPWAAIATGSMAAVTLISALMNKHGAHTG